MIHAVLYRNAVTFSSPGLDAQRPTLGYALRRGGYAVGVIQRPRAKPLYNAFGVSDGMACGPRVDRWRDQPWAGECNAYGIGSAASRQHSNGAPVGESIARIVPRRGI